jgi:RES domain-containing protein
LTSDNLQLDPEILLSKQPITLFRIARKRYANLSGVGAASAPGRWNRLGQEAIYTSTEVGVPVLERLVHMPKDTIPSNLALMMIRIQADWQMQESAFIDSRTGRCIWIYRSLLEARKAFAAGSHRFGGGVNPFAVAVPSVVVPAWNLVLYPQGNGFWEHVSLQSIDVFEFDPRLFPIGAVPEPL